FKNARGYKDKNYLFSMYGWAPPFFGAFLSLKVDLVDLSLLQYINPWQAQYNGTVINLKTPQIIAESDPMAGFPYPFKRYTSCVNVPNVADTYNGIYIYTSLGNPSGSGWVDDFELIEDNFNAGADISLPCGSSTILGGQDFCMLSNMVIRYDWTDPLGTLLLQYTVKHGMNGFVEIRDASGSIIPNIPSIIVSPTIPTLYTLTRTIVDYAGAEDLVLCTLSDDILVAVYGFGDACFLTEVCDHTVLITPNVPGGDNVWDMGDNTTYNFSSAFQHTYSVPGTYNICRQLGIECPSICCIEIIIPQSAPVNADFIFQQEPCPILDIQFSSNEQGWNHSWNFDGLGSSTQPNPIFTFPSNGVYEVTHTVTNICGSSSSVTKLVNIICTENFACPCTGNGSLNIDASEGNHNYDAILGGTRYSVLEAGFNYDQDNNGILDANDHHGCIAISGRLIIDRDVEIKSCGEVKMQPCSEIWVGTGESSSPYPSLLLYLNNLYGCEQMWKGITVQQYCMLTMGKNSIEDAQFAVTALGSNLIQPPASPPTRFYALTNFFRNNHVGVYIPTNRKQSVLHAPFHYNNFIGRIPGKPLLPPCDASLPNYSDQMGYAGLVTLGTAFDVGTPGTSGYVNTFRDIRNGVIGENDALVNVYRARFDNVPGYMGINGNPSFAASSGVGVLFRRGICSVKNSRFEGVGHAVFANSTAGLSVLQNQMPDVFTGVQAMTPRGFTINENQSIGFRDWGIFTRNPSQLLPLNSELLIEDNHLHSIEDDADGVIEEAGITVVLSNNISNTEDARIAGNRLTTRDLQFGILMNTANNWLLDDNRVTIEPLLTNLPHTGTGGITLFSSANNWLYGNTVTDNGTDPSVGIWAASAPGNTYCCNTTSYTNWGTYFQGTCDNTTLRETLTDGNDDFALECTPGTVISLQPDLVASPGDNHSNQFHVGSNAQHGGNDGQVQNSEFFVRTNVPLDHPENIFLPNIHGGYDPANPKWFFATGFANKDCNAIGGCPAPEYGYPRNRDRELSETDTYYASGGFLGSPYGEALNWEGKLRLYKRMQKYPELAGQSTTVDAFYTNAGNNLVGMYAAVDGAIASINTLPQPWQVAIQNAQGAVQTAITTADGQLSALASVSTWEDSMAIYRTAEQTRLLALPAYESLMQYLHLADSLHNTKAQAAWLINQALPATDILQSNRKTVNRVYLETVAQGITTLTPAQYADIAPIAWQCPLEGGGAVYTARALYQLQTAAIFDDRLLCGLSNQERGTHRGNAPPPEALKVQPNPTSDELLVTLPDGVLSEELIMKVININGMEVFSKQVSGETTMLIDVSKLPAGLYTLFATGKSTTPAPVKFVVQH
ncbi:MAG TPA: hypothetical protein DCF33_12565, partial [Saprospirales bacterium]|nr:hypothetical protein [Saprospirales bacterium]